MEISRIKTFHVWCKISGPPWTCIKFGHPNIKKVQLETYLWIISATTTNVQLKKFSREVFRFQISAKHLHNFRSAYTRIHNLELQIDWDVPRVTTKHFASFNCSHHLLLIQVLEAEIIEIGKLSVGDSLLEVSMSSDTLVPSAIVEISLQTGKGLYNPHTTTGNIVVNGVLALTFTNALPQSTMVHSVITAPLAIIHSLCPTNRIAELLNSLILQFINPWLWEIHTD